MYVCSKLIAFNIKFILFPEDEILICSSLWWWLRVARIPKSKRERWRERERKRERTIFISSPNQKRVDSSHFNPDHKWASVGRHIILYRWPHGLFSPSSVRDDSKLFGAVWVDVHLLVYRIATRYLRAKDRVLIMKLLNFILFDLINWF